jgi:chaperonin GroEL (HSP60 family)
MVDELNALIRVDNLPYHLTHFVRETVNDTPTTYTIHTRAYPKVIMKESEFLHENAIAPVLTLLERPHFRGANAEYLAALEDYRKGDIPDCLTKCGSAFESVLKIICGRKGWAFGQTDTARTLINIVLRNTSLEPYFESPLLIIAKLRNRLSSSHGAGAAVQQPARHIAQYALNATASAILLIAQETGEY